MVAIREAKRALPALKNLAVSEVEWADDIFRFIRLSRVANRSGDC
jgi:hypothetical protein